MEQPAYYLISDGTTGVPEICLVIDVADQLGPAIALYMQHTGIPRNQIVVNPVLGPIDTPA